MSGAESRQVVTDGTYRALLAQGSYLLDCEGAYESDVSLCVAVADGRVSGVTVRTDPPRPEVEECLRDAVSALSFEPNLGFDVTEVTFAGRGF